MNGINKVILAGRIDQGPFTSHGSNGLHIARIDLITTESYINKEGDIVKNEQQKHQLVFFAQAAEYVSKNLRKGMMILAEGKLKHRLWKDDFGNEKPITEVSCNHVQIISADKIADEISSDDIPY